MPYLQGLFDEEFSPGKRYYFKGGFLPAFPDAAIEAVLEHLRARPSPLSEFDLHHVGAAVHRIGGHRLCRPLGNLHLQHHRPLGGPAEDDAIRDWARSLASALAPFGRGRDYVNFLSEPAGARILETTYGKDRCRRLSELKRR
ncbi:MAG: hypothetical protein ACRDJ4_09445 [Actinomycetota bacterium]